VFGSGPYAGHKDIVGSRGNAHLEAHLPQLFHLPSMVPTQVDLNAWSKDVGGPLAIIRVDYRIFLIAKHGISVTAMDPGTGTMIETVTFGEGPDLETWRRYSVVDSTPATQP
jgi:hypothetical protein